MLVTKKVSLSGDWAKVGVDFKDGDIIIILNDGETVQGEYGERQVFKVKTTGGEKNLSFNQTSMNNLIDGYGSETAGWINKEAQVWIIKQMVSGTLKNVAYITPKGWMMTEDGKFVAPNTTAKNDDTPTIEEAVDNIPFNN